MNNALNKAIKKIRKNIFHNYKLYTNNFIITNIEKIDFWSKKNEYYFYNLY